MALVVGSGDTPSHIPVLLAPVLEALSPRDGGLYLDGTFGAGGYTRAILDAADCRVIALDRDPNAIADGRALEAHYGGRLTLIETAFADMNDHVAAELDGVVLDIGVSSMQLDQAVRGFSFQKDGPLDMRMAQAGPTAADVVNTSDERLLADILFRFGEERRSRALARAIVSRRDGAPFETTGDLTDVIEQVLGPVRPHKLHPATRTFQALRIHVNDELGQLARALYAAERLLRPGGRLAIVTFHSLEDRVVKRFFQSRGRPPRRGSRHAPPQQSGESEQVEQQTFRIVNQRPLGPSNEEVSANPRARSARLRWGERTDVPVSDDDGPDDRVLKALGVPLLGGS